MFREIMVWLGQNPEAGIGGFLLMIVGGTAYAASGGRSG